MAAIYAISAPFFASFTMTENIAEFADLKQVKVFRAGRHNGRTFQDADLELMARNTNACLDYILESQDAGKYPGNEGINLGGKPIPAFLNLNHQQDLAETIKQAVRNIGIKFYTQAERGVKWLMADLTNVPADVAKFVKERYPLRSIEILPPIYHPKRQSVFSHVLRSIAFLSPDQPPAVSGQQNDFIVAYSAPLEGLIECYTISTEVPKMEEQEIKKQPTPPVNPQSQPDPAILEFQAALKAKDAEIAQLRQEFEAQKAQTERKEIDAFCDALILRHGVKPAAVNADVRAQLHAMNHAQVLEFANGVKKTQREFWLDYLAEVLPVSASVPVGEFAAAQVNDTAQPKTTEDEIQTFEKQARELFPNADPRDLYVKQVELWTESKKGGR